MRPLLISLLTAIALFATSVSSAQEPARLALLLGNKGYAAKVGALKNPHADVDLVGTALVKLGFKVAIIKDATYKQMDTAVKRYASEVRRAGPAALSFFYYSGHGIANPDTQLNYLIPVDVADADDDKVWFESMQQSVIIDTLSRQAPTATHYLVFDACRNELSLSGQAAKSIGSDKGFVPVADTSGLLIAYATAPKRTASDAGEGGGPYAKVLAEELVRPGVESVSMFRSVQIRVKQAIGQDPWLSFPSLPPVYLAGRSGEQAPAAAPALSQVVAAGVAAREWQDLKDTTSIAVLERFAQLRKDDPIYAALALDRVETLKRQQQAPAAPSPPTPERPAAITRPAEVRVVTSAADALDRILPAVVSISAQKKGAAVDLSSGTVAAQKGTSAGAPSNDVPGLPADHPLNEFFKNLPKSRSGGPSSSQAANTNPETSNAQGAGWLLSADGYIITSYTIVDAATQIDVTTSDGGKFRPVLVGMDADAGLALLKIDAGRPLATLKSSARAPVKGEPVLLIGNPFGLGHSVRIAHVSGSASAGKLFDMIEFSGAVAAGDAGGIIVDLNGGVLGVVDSYRNDGSDGTAKGSATPAHIAEVVFASLKSSGQVSKDAVRAQAAKSGPIGTSWPPRVLATEPPAARTINAQVASVAILKDGSTGKSNGLGFFISADGYVVTTDFVIEKAKTVTVRRQDGSTLNADVVGTDARTQLALLKVRAEGVLPFVSFAERPGLAGDSIFAWNLHELGKTILRSGVIAHAARDIGSGPYNIVQSDLWIDKGEAGAAWFNAEGQVVAIGSTIYSRTGKATGTSFGIPAMTASTVVQQLRSKGRVDRGWFGARIQNLDQSIAEAVGLAQARGSIINDVTPSGAADQAGLKMGDVVLAINGANVTDSRDFARKIADQLPGAVVQVEIQRNGSRETRSVTLGVFPTAPTEPAAAAKAGAVQPALPSSTRAWVLPDAVTSGERLPDLGLELVSVSTVSKSDNAVKDGLFVVAASGDAAVKGLKRGDIILEVNGEPFRWVREAQARVNDGTSLGRRAMLLRVRSGEATRFVAVQLGDQKK